MAVPVKHLEPLIIEQLAEGSLPARAAATARAHLQECAFCRDELAMVRSIFGALATLPRYAPSAAFADSVMARVQLSRRESPALAWLRRIAPRTRRGWLLMAAAVVAPAIPAMVLLAWLLSQPLLTPAMLWQWTLVRTQATAQAGLGWLLDRTVDSGLLAWAEGSYATVQTVPVVTLGGVVVMLAVAIPLSAYALIHLTRTPVGRPNHAK